MHHLYVWTQAKNATTVRNGLCHGGAHCACLDVIIQIVSVRSVFGIRSTGKMCIRIGEGVRAAMRLHVNAFVGS